WSPSTSYRAATGSFPRRRNSWLTTSPTGSPAHLLAALSPSRTSTAPSRGIFSAAIGRRAISLRSASPRTAAARASIERPAAVLDSVQKQETVKSMVGGREMVVGRKSCLSFNDGRRKNSGWTMYEFEMCSSGGFETRVLCHVKRSSHCAYPAAPPSKRLRPP
ncbi:unnamed protein product, partial [Musa acuminata subsp. burmannicoides]